MLGMVPIESQRLELKLIWQLSLWEAEGLSRVADFDNLLDRVAHSLNRWTRSLLNPNTGVWFCSDYLDIVD